jgi:uncharacterized protein YPO0396
MTDRTVHLGQFRLTRLQVVNWGTFSGYKDLPIDERGVLFTGPSGSGKSSLMDAHSLVLLPVHDQRFNASADLTARGAKQATRSVADYVRGAWSETNDEHAQSRARYLRGGRATWSAVAATYDNGLGGATTALVVKWFTGAETDGSSLRSLYHLYEGAFEATVLEEWAARGFDTRWLRANHPGSHFDTQEKYLRELSRRVGVGTSKIALSLLGKAKAMKNVGDLNMFISGNMLDEPETFAAAAKMLDTFNPLNEAYDTARRAHAQEKVLHDLPGAWAAYQASGDQHALAEALLGPPLELYVRGLQLDAVRAGLEEIDNTVEQLDGQLSDLQEQCHAAERDYKSLDSRLRRDGGALERLQDQLHAARGEIRARRHAYEGFGRLVEALGQPAPTSQGEFDELRASLASLVSDATAELARLTPRRYPLFASAAKLRDSHQAKEKELAQLRSARSLIPQRHRDRRDLIAQGAGIPAGELSYAAELIDVADGEERWRPAAEKVLRGFGLRLLVPERYQRAVMRFIDDHDMRGVAEYSVVTPVAAPAPPPAHTLAGKLTVDTGHPSGGWLAAQLARRFDHVCVESAAELDAHPAAVTIHGTVKQPGNVYRKDDRRELTNPSAYILGANTSAKTAALEVEAADLAKRRQDLEAEADAVDRRCQVLDRIIAAGEQVGRYTSWAPLDHWRSTAAAGELEAALDEVRGSDGDLRALEQRRDDADQRWKDLLERCAGVKAQLSGYNDRQAALIAILEHEQDRPHGVDGDAERAYLDEAFAATEVTVDPAAIEQARTALRKELQARRDAANAERNHARSRVKTALDRFLEEWPDAAPDSSGDVDASGADFAALHADITQRRLPEAMARFQRMISEDMVPSISVLQRAIENAATDIRRRIDMVNAGLRRVEFNAGRHLQIAYKANPSPDVREFRKMVDTLLSQAPAARGNPPKLLAQFQRVQALMARFTATDPESRRWCANVLDVRTSYVFYGLEQDAAGQVHYTYRNTSSNSGGEQEKLVAFCLAAALSYNLADPGGDGLPRFAPLMLDEAFSKSDEEFSRQALAAFDDFGFQLIIAAPIRMAGILEPFIGQAVLVDKRVFPDGARSHAASATFGDLAPAAAARAS